MSYTALYRKWRSQTFDEVKGQEPITESFKNQIKTGRIGHAFLFTGTRGTGKTSVAKILARAVNCENPVDGNPCNECPSCKSILDGSSMNVVEMDAASNNGVDDIRQIRDKIEYPPVGGRYKVYIIDEVHMLSTAAFNAFLKTLEEPPEYVIFILATTEPNKIPITILSRCQRYDFRRISAEVIAQRLKEIASSEGIPITDEALEYIARVGDGSMRDSVSLLDQCQAFHFEGEITYDAALEILGAVDTRIFSELIRALSNREIRTCLTALADMIQQGRELTQFVSDFLFYVRNILMAKTVTDLHGLVDMSTEDLARLKEDATLLTIEQIMRYIRILSELTNQLRYNTEKRVLIETTLMKLAFPETDIDKEAINSRLSELEEHANASAMTIQAAQLIASASPQMTSQTSLPPSASTQNSATTESLTATPVNGTVQLPKAQYEDLILLKKEWKNLASLMSSGLYRSAILNSWVYPAKGNQGMVIETTSPASYMTLSAEETLAEIQKIVSEKYKKDIQFKANIKKNTDNQSTIFVSDDDLKSKINMTVEIETDDMEDE